MGGKVCVDRSGVVGQITLFLEGSSLMSNKMPISITSKIYMDYTSNDNQIIIITYIFFNYLKQ